MADDLFDVFDEAGGEDAPQSSHKRKKELQDRQKDGGEAMDLDEHKKKGKDDDEDDLFDIFEEDEKGKEPQTKKQKLKSDSGSNNDQTEVVELESDDESAPPPDSHNQDKEEEEEVQPYEEEIRVSIHQLETKESCIHEVVTPADIQYVPLRPRQGKPAKEYGFILDPFQEESITCIENSQSVLVSAHTSAGKTVVAEYAIAMSLRDKQRVIYTTPIKALSNQKYREFYEEFQDVGLITGDVTINPTASCLIMTTEILRQMLFRGNEIMREVGWVIFDEIHYMRDKERGVVWEETIIMLPDSVHYVFLSATIPNARQFAEWIAHLHHQSCHVVYTDYRPVPLQHYCYPSGGDGLHLVLDEQGNFREENFNQAMSVLQNMGDAAQGDFHGGQGLRRRGSGRGGHGGESNCFKVIKTITERGLAPVIAFSFSKKECEAYALQMIKLNFNSPEEKQLVNEVFANAIDVLSDEDKKLPQIQQVLPLLERGIGIHHSGLLPIIKETIEILFGEGLLKVLFATETFAMGLNMPARTVVFTNAHKFDGVDFRWITSGEYIQMSGRAGRRGLDERGIVVLIVDEKMSPAVGKDLIKGKPDPINSAFHLTYNMVLNLLRVEEINPEYMLQHSFYQFQHYALVPQLKDKIRELEEACNSIVVPNESRVRDYVRLKEELVEMSLEFVRWIQKPQAIVPFLQPGRLIKIKSQEGIDLGWGPIISYNKKNNKKHNPVVRDSTYYTIDVLLYLKRDLDPKNQPIEPPADNERGEMKIVTLALENIVQVSSARIFIPQDLRGFDSRQSVYKAVNEVKKRFNNRPPLLDPIEDMKITDKAFKSLIAKIESYETRLKDFKECDPQTLEIFRKKLAIEERIKNVKQELRKAQSLLQMDELKCMKRVLRRLGYCTATDVIEIKGRVACEISSGDELLLTEMLFNGVFNDMNPYQINAILSCFVFEEKTEQMPKLTEELAGPLQKMQELAKRIAKVSKEAKLQIDEERYVEGFKPNLMDVVYNWSKGASFASILKMTDAFEGSIIRCMRRLEELLRQMCQAAKVIGNHELELKFSEADRLIKRDIVFAASLYL